MSPLILFLSLVADATLGKSIVLLQENKLMIDGGQHHGQLAASKML